MPYTVSGLMGHADPGETVRGDIRLLDWMFGRHVRREPIMFSSAERAYLLDLTPGSLRVFRGRQEIRGETTALDLLRWVLPRWHTLLADPTLEGTEPPAPLFAPLEVRTEPLPPPDPWLLYAMFYRHAGDEPIPEVAARFGYPVTDLERWLGQAAPFAHLKPPKG